MWQLIAALGMMANMAQDDSITLRVENTAGCAVRVQVMQFGNVRYNLLVEANRTITERVRVQSSSEPVSFRVIGIGCPFTRYEVDALNAFHQSLLLRLHNMPILSTLVPYRARKRGAMM
jgi:hypothetical protein